MVRISIWLIFMVLLAVISMSCDTGSLFTRMADAFVEKNFIWSDEPDQPFNRHIDSCYTTDTKGNLYIAARWRGKEMMAGSYTFIFMCCSQDAGDAYELDHGIILDYTQPAKMVKDTSIRSFGILQPDKFKSRPISKNNIRLLYNGALSGYNTANNLPTSRNWLRFDMRTKKSPEQVNEYVRRVLPFLQAEEDVEAITACLQKLIQ